MRSKKILAGTSVDAHEKAKSWQEEEYGFFAQVTQPQSDPEEKEISLLSYVQTAVKEIKRAIEYDDNEDYHEVLRRLVKLESDSRPR